MPSGAPRIEAFRAKILKLRTGPGFSADRVLPALGTDFVDETPVPVPLHSMFGCGDPARRVHPSAWCNPFASMASTEEEAVAKFKCYAYSRADVASWLHPLSGKRLVAEVGIQGAHAYVLSGMLLELAENKETQNKMATDTNDEDGTDTDEMDSLLPYSPFCQLNANTIDGCICGDVDGLELTVRAMGEQGLNIGKEIF